MNSHHPLVYISSSAVQASNPVDALEQIIQITPNIELTGGCSHDPGLLHKLIAFQQSHDVNLLLHSYFPPPAEHFVLNFANTSIRTRDFISRSMEYVGALHIPYYSIHAGFKKDFVSDRGGILHKISDRVFTLDDIGENADWFRSQWPDTPLVLENIYPNGGDTSCAFMMSCDEICQALDTIQDIFLLLDLGHLKVSAHLMGFDLTQAVTTLFQRYGNRIKELHLSENNGLIDDHLPINRESFQYHISHEYSQLLLRYGINLTLETRTANTDNLSSSYKLIQSIFINNPRGTTGSNSCVKK